MSPYFDLTVSCPAEHRASIKCVTQEQFVQGFLDWCKSHEVCELSRDDLAAIRA